MCEESCSTKNTIKLCSASLFFLTDSASGQSLFQLPEAEDNNTERQALIFTFTPMTNLELHVTLTCMCKGREPIKVQR